jgi:PAS domain S-box-containing protein
MKTAGKSSHPLGLGFPQDVFKDKRLEGFIKSLLDNIAIGITILGTGMEILWMNKNFRDAFPEIDLSKTPFCYKTFYSPPREKVCDHCPSVETFRTGEVHEAETDACSNGRIYRLIASPVKDEEGRVISVVETAIDITEQKQTEKRLREAKKDWEETFDRITDMITIHDKDFNIIRTNRSAEEILKLPELEVNKVIKCFKYYHGTDCPPQGCPSCECLKTGKPAVFELFEPHLNRHIEIRAMPRFDEKEQIIGLIHIVRDITERKKTEERTDQLLNEIIMAKTQWEMTFDCASELILLIDKELNIIKCNRSFANFAQTPIKELIGKKCTDFLPCTPEDMMSTEETIIRKEVKTDKDIWLYLSFYTIRDERGDVLHYIIIGMDVTELKNTQQRLLNSERDLKKRVNELEKFYRIAIDREARMRELKIRVKQLTDEIQTLRKAQV